MQKIRISNNITREAYPGTSLSYWRNLMHTMNASMQRQWNTGFSRMKSSRRDHNIYFFLKSLLPDVCRGLEVIHGKKPYMKRRLCQKGFPRLAGHVFKLLRGLFAGVLTRGARQNSHECGVHRSEKERVNVCRS